MIPSWNIANWIPQVVPYMLRKAKTIAWLNVLLSALKTTQTDVLAYRDEVLAEMLPNAQTMSLEWHLNNLYDPADRRIYIVSASEFIPSQIIYNAAEADDDPYIYNAAEALTDPVIYNSSESFTGNFFIVYVPAAVNDPQIPFTLNRYKLSGTKYQIIET